MCSKQLNKSHNEQPQDHDTTIEECKASKEGKEEKGYLENINTNPPSSPDPLISFITEKAYQLNSFLESLNLVPRSSDVKFFCTKENDGDVMFIEIIKKCDDSYEEELGEDESTVTGGLEVEYFDIFPTRSELTYHKYLMCGPILSLFLRNPIIVEGCPSNLKIPCNKDMKDPKGIRRIRNFTGRIKGMHIFIGNFTYVLGFMIVEDISSIKNPRLSQVVLGKPFMEISNMTHDLSLGAVKFTNGSNEIAYKKPYKIEQYNSLSNMEKEHTKLDYLRNEDDKTRVVEYVMGKILGFYKECLELGHKYLTALKDEGGVT
uniref:Retrotransposon Orf1 n=1 Tax=Tanacetum cinerariifolium TaxID=118510 RepID=A0A699GW71_TANCI|nr:retrotransposon Orf1 [Tanacetum cinerariifolium]